MAAPSKTRSQTLCYAPSASLTRVLYLTAGITNASVARANPWDLMLLYDRVRLSSTDLMMISSGIPRVFTLGAEEPNNGQSAIANL